MYRLLSLLLLSLFFTPAVWAAKPILKTEYMVVYKKKVGLEDTIDAAKIAITDRGIVINNIAYIAKMLNRTGKDLGRTKKIYIESRSLEFCSSTISRDTMEATPLNIMFCPYIINLYTLVDEPDYVYVGYRRPPIIGDAASKKSLTAVEKLLEDIVQDTLSW
ncbi:MAG: hypothetical protein BMS9Abin36_0746 [Gammaproteobacteria bacterium]|nr:MAG: hypothetical protein BMS9Abin36_0746 [Gammaproteobacteria bacterium]